MAHELRLSGYPEPLGLWVRDASRPEARPALRARDFEFSSRGDRVWGRLLLPATGGGPHPLLMLQPAGGAACSDAVLATGGPWARRGVAVASIDLPLHGARADHKLLARLPDGASPDPAGAALAFEFARQAVIDLERTLDALAALEWIDAERIVYVGLGAGAAIGAAFCALDARPGAVALGFDGAGPASGALDPRRHVAGLAPRPLLVLGGGPAEDVASAAAAAGSPVERHEGGIAAAAGALPEAALEAVWRFAAERLGLGDA